MRKPTALSIDTYVRDMMLRLDEGEDPRSAIAQLNRRIVAYQQCGEDVPSELMRLSKRLATECAVHSQGR